MRTITEYKTLVFDCDGVVLNSNFLKIDAYFATAKNFGASDAEAQALVDYHIRLGGISRFVKFDYFLKEIVHQPVTEAVIQALLADFGQEVERRLLDCEIAPGLEALRQETPSSRWVMVSGGDQNELRKILSLRGIASLFDAGIFGSPDNKDVILAREFSGNLEFPAVFFGDSRYDHEASTHAGLDFVFMSGWTDFAGWQAYCQQHKIEVMDNISALRKA
jgi:phosphoglycolate phosphatase-like HAD superfamily hydrolase